MAKVTVVTASVGNPLLQKTIESVARQTHEDVQHLILIDGPERTDAVYDITSRMHINDLHKVVLHTLPYPIGKDRWNGHRIYAAGTYMAEGEYIIYLDDDNYLDSTHIEECLKVIEKGRDWAFSFRKIVNKNGVFICKDDCESLGKWASVLHPEDYFVDVNCYFLPIRIAVSITPAWYRKFREPGQMEVDRVLTHFLRQISMNYDSTYNYTLNYTAGNSQYSVQPEFFLHGNQQMLAQYNNKLPWVA